MLRRRRNPANLLVASNPSARKSGASPKQRAASRRNIKKAQAALRRLGHRRANPARKVARSGSPRSGARRGVRRNPFRAPDLGGIVQRQLMPALIGGAGAVGNDLLYNAVAQFLPAAAEPFRSGYMRHLGKVVSALLLGTVAPMVVPRRMADQLVAGALVVTGFNFLRDVSAQFLPQLPLGCYDGMGAYIRPRLGYAGAGYNPTGVLPPQGSNFRRSGLQAYITPRLRGLGAYGRGTNAFGVPPQLKQPNPFVGRKAPDVDESYRE